VRDELIAHPVPSLDLVGLRGRGMSPSLHWSSSIPSQSRGRKSSWHCTAVLGSPTQFLSFRYWCDVFVSLSRPGRLRRTRRQRPCRCPAARPPRARWPALFSAPSRGAAHCPSLLAATPAPTPGTRRRLGLSCRGTAGGPVCSAQPRSHLDHNASGRAGACPRCQCKAVASTPHRRPWPRRGRCLFALRPIAHVAGSPIFLLLPQGQNPPRSYAPMPRVHPPQAC